MSYALLHLIDRWALLLIGLALAGVSRPAEAQTTATRAGGLASPGTVLSADATLNARLASGATTAGDVLGLGQQDDRPVVTFSPTPDRRWAAYWNVRAADSQTISGFVYDGYLYTPTRVRTNRRQRRFPDDVTGRVASNAHHLAFLRTKGVEREMALFVTRREGGTVHVKLPADLLGTARTLTFNLAPLQGRFLLLNATASTYRVPWSPPPTARGTARLDADWRVALGVPEDATPWASAFDDAAWDIVQLPHSWNTRDMVDRRGLTDGLDIGPQYHRGIGWYRLRFVPEKGPRDHRRQLRFPGTANAATVWLNGQRIGEHEGGYTPFALDVTEVLRPGQENVLAVRVDNRFGPARLPHAADFTFYGGLYRAVHLQTTAPVHVATARVDTPEASTAEATVRVRTILANAGRAPQTVRLVTRIEHPDGGIIATAHEDHTLAPGDSATIRQTLSLSRPLLWGPQHPHLYTVHSTLYDAAAAPGPGANGRELLPAEGADYAPLDHVTHPLGIRFFAWTAEKGFSLNGKPLKLRGVSLHQDYLLRANAVERSQKRRDLARAKAMGANFVRLAHYPHHPATPALADSLGLLVWAEIPFITSDPTALGFEHAAAQMLRALILRDYNHPSIILWGVGNETVISWQTETVQAAATALTARLHALAKRLDPTRLTVQAQNHVLDPALMDVTDIQARNQYFGWYEGAPDEIGPALDRYHTEHPHWRLFVSEYGAGAQRGRWTPDSLAQPFDFSETWQLAFHETYLDAIETRPFVAGGAVWHLFDFGSHVKTGTLPHLNQKGLLTADRRPKAAYYLYQSRWTDAPMAYLLAHTRTHRRAGTVRVEAFTNAPAAELFVDGASAGTHSRAGRSTRLSWDVPLREGTHALRIIARWPDGRTATDTATVFVVPSASSLFDESAPTQLDGDN